MGRESDAIQGYLDKKTYFADFFNGCYFHGAQVVLPDALEEARQHAEEEARRAKEAYAKAAEQYELAKSEIDRLAEQHKAEIEPDAYHYFVENLSMLTPAEYRIYELYLSGKSAKQIAEILHITENTIKYHNKNIYSKLGISSRKQLLRFAALKQHRDGKEDWS